MRKKKYKVKYYFFHSSIMRLVFASNRLPLSITDQKGNLKLLKSSGGLATGLTDYIDYFKKISSKNEYLWVGWPGSPQAQTDKDMQILLKKNNLYPIWLSEEEIENYYNGFCNNTIWPLFHYFPSYTFYKPSQWQSYKQINERFCEKLLKIIKPTDTIWIQDFHLMLLPKLLREKMPEVTIGFFLHIPFPVFEIFRLLPDQARREILTGILGADLVGFHTYNYSRYFIECIQRILGYEQNLGIIQTEDRLVKVDTFPIGIDFQKFHKGAKNSQVQLEIKKFKKKISNVKTILSIDRLDYTKGIKERLKAYELFLRNNPQWQKKVVLILIIIPSRIQVERYKKMKRTIDELVGKINGAFGSINWTPIIYQYKGVSFHQLSALYNMSDVALVTALRDGMNLIAKEYIASRRTNKGVLILSEMAGAAEELGEAIIINPNDQQEMASALKQALTMPLKEQKERNHIMQNRLKRYTVKRWANDFMNELDDFKKTQKKEETKFFKGEIRNQILKEFAQAQKKLLFLDYDGTLIALSKFPNRAKPDEHLIQIIKNLSCFPDIKIVIISGRKKEILERWFQKLNVDLVSEHGVWIKPKGLPWEMLKAFSNNWKKAVMPILKRYEERLPGSLVEEKEFSIAWHYRSSDPELANLRAQDLNNTLMHLTVNLDVHVIHGNRIIEVRNSGADKGNAALNFLEKENYDFILGIGDDTTDEDLFKALPQKAYSLKIGNGQSAAKFFLHGYRDTLKLLEDFACISSKTIQENKK